MALTRCLDCNLLFDTRHNCTKVKKIDQTKYSYEGDVYVIASEFKYKGQYDNRDIDYVVLCDPSNDYNSFRVVEKNRLKKETDTYRHQQIKKLEEEIKELEKNKKQRVDKLVDDSIKALSFRMKLNSLFSSKEEKIQEVGIAIAKELEKLIKEKGGEIK